MKKLFLTFGLMVAMTTITPPMYARETPNCTIYLVPEQPRVDPNAGHSHSPIRPLTIGQDGHTLYFSDEMDCFVNLYTIDEDGEKTLEYATLVSGESVQLPSYLQGTFVIELVTATKRYVGEIELDYTD